MIGYFHKIRGGFELTICKNPCNGIDFNNSEKIRVSSKAEARKICKERKVKEYNF